MAEIDIWVGGDPVGKVNEVHRALLTGMVRNLTGHRSVEEAVKLARDEIRRLDDEVAARIETRRLIVEGQRARDRDQP